MKYVLLLFYSTLLFNTSISQTWFEVGVKGGPSTTFLVNKNLMDDAQFNPQLTFSYFYGAKIGINFGEHNGIAIHAGMSQVRQDFANEYELSIFDERRFNASVLDIGMLYHRTKESGYFEIGPRISLVQNATLSDDGGSAYDISDQVNRSYYGMDLGFGSFVLGNDHLSLMVGLRFSYGISPIIEDERPVTPLLVNYENEKSIHVFSGMICFELNYSLGYLVRSTCGRRNTWLSF